MNRLEEAIAKSRIHFATGAWRPPKVLPEGCPRVGEIVRVLRDTFQRNEAQLEGLRVILWEVQMLSFDPEWKAIRLRLREQGAFSDELCWVKIAYFTSPFEFEIVKTLEHRTAERLMA